MREKITSITFIAIIAVFFALVAIFPKDERASVQENRPLASMPAVSFGSVASGKFGSEFETYITDNVGFRSKLVKLGTVFENSRGISQEDAGQVIYLANGSQLALNDGKIMEVYKKNPEAMTRYISVLNDYSRKFAGKANMYLLLAPTQIEFDKSEYHKLADSQQETIDEVYSSVNGFKTVDAYSKLKEHSGEYIYFRTDHHWTQRGAYCGYSALMETMGETPVKLESLTANKVSGFLGYLYNQANVEKYAKYADDIEYFVGEENYLIGAKIKENDKIVDYQAQIYMPIAEGTAPNYGLFMGSDHPFAEVQTNVKNGKTALVIKDSYANALLPLLTNNYERILIIDPRNYYGTVSQLMEENEIDDIIVINYVFTTTLPGYIDAIESVR